MDKNKITYAIIQTAVNKGMADIKENPARGLRNLVELGKNFAISKNQKQFFEMAYTRLIDQNSSYHVLAKHIINTVNNEFITTYGINLGYNSLVVSSELLRETENRLKCNIPWCIALEINSEEDICQAKDIINQGKEQGIFSYLIIIKKGLKSIRRLVSLVNNNKDIVCNYYVHPDDIKEDSPLLQAFFHCLISVEFIETPSFKRAIGILRDNKMLFGAHTNISEENQVEPLMDKALSAGVDILFFNPWGDILLGAASKRIYDKIVAVRLDLNMPLVPIDLRNDLFYVCSVISERSCILTISNSKFTLIKADSSVQVLNNARAKADLLECLQALS